VVPAFATANPTKSAQADGARTNETNATAAVTPTAVAARRHSPRATNHRTPMPGPILVSSTKDQAAGRRSPTTIAAATIDWMFPTSARVIGLASGEPYPITTAETSPAAKTTGAQLRVAAQSAAKTMTCQATRKAGQPIGRTKPTTWASAGGYTYREAVSAPHTSP